MIFVKSRKSAERTLRNILPFIERKLFLKVNMDKTRVGDVRYITYLGFTFYIYKGKARIRIHPKAVRKMKAKVKELTLRNKGISNESRALKLRKYIIGWVNYFKLADMKSLLKEIDRWMR